VRAITVEMFPVDAVIGAVAVAVPFQGGIGSDAPALTAATSAVPVPTRAARDTVVRICAHDGAAIAGSKRSRADAELCLPAPLWDLLPPAEDGREEM
jgi:hypothetical protein